jgi:DNA polymerase III delta prime subunit
VFDEVDRLTTGAQQSLRSAMDLKRCMYFFTTNYLSKIDMGIVNRCHLVEMNKVTRPASYRALGHNILKSLGMGSDVVSETTLDNLAIKSRGSLRNYNNSVMLEGLTQGGAVTFKTTP